MEEPACTNWDWTVDTQTTPTIKDHSTLSRSRRTGFRKPKSTTIGAWLLTLVLLCGALYGAYRNRLHLHNLCNPLDFYVASSACLWKGRFFG